MKCKDCYWFSSVTVQMCEREHEPTTADEEACSLFEEAEET